MPAGTTHARASLALAAGGSLIAYYQLELSLLYTAALGGGALLGAIVTPDLDVDNGCISRGLVRKTAGRMASSLWAAFWRPYSLLMPHRSHLSHFPFIGTALRLLYLSILPALVYWFSSGSMAALRFPEWGWYVVAGLVLSDMLHWAMDNFW